MSGECVVGPRDPTIQRLLSIITDLLGQPYDSADVHRCVFESRPQIPAAAAAATAATATAVRRPRHHDVTATVYRVCQWSELIVACPSKRHIARR
jgi:hypothetical protein